MAIYEGEVFYLKIWEKFSNLDIRRIKDCFSLRNMQNFLPYFPVALINDKRF